MVHRHSSGHRRTKQLLRHSQLPISEIALQVRLPFLEFEPLLNHPLLNVRYEFWSHERSLSLK